MPFPSELHIIYLNLSNHKHFWDYQPVFMEYLENMDLFLQKYLFERYGLSINVWHYEPNNYVPTSYEGLQLYDKFGFSDKYFGKQFQMYVIYGLDLQPHPEFGADLGGYAECRGRPDVKPEDMMYVEMYEYDPRFARSPYEWWGDFSRRVTHELDHQILFLQKDVGYVTKVHKAKNLPLVRWDLRCTDKQGNAVCFYSQVDPRSC